MGKAVKRCALIGLVAVGLAVGQASSAAAAVTIGETATGTPTCGSSATLRVQSQLGGPGSYDVPSAGVLTSWSVRANGADQLELKVVDPTNAPSMQWGILATSAAQTTSGSAINTFPTRIPVSAGSRIALWTLGGGSTCVFSTASATDVYEFGPNSADPSNGATYATNGSDSFRRVNVSAQLEPDADGDDYGDETQDLCPTDATAQGPCPDRIAPETAITKAPPRKVKSKSKSARISVEFDSTESGASFKCSLDGATATPCVSPFTAKVKKGSHSFSVTATDSAGNADPSAATATFTVKKKKRKKHHHH